MAGPLLARRAKAAGVVYSLAWGDQPALICEQVDWARAAGFKVICSRQGHALRAALPQVQSRQCLGHPRQVSEYFRPQVDQSENVQLLRRRHQVRHRDDGGVQRHRPRAAVGRPALSAGDALRARRHLQAEGRRRHAGEGRRHRGRLLRSIATAATCRIISRSAPMWCSRARPNTRAAASRNTPCCRTEAANTPRSTGRSI